MSPWMVIKQMNRKSLNMYSLMEGEEILLFNQVMLIENILVE
jgi:hypothetical protein